MTQTNVETIWRWRHEITSSAGPEDREGKRIILDSKDLTYQEYLRAVLLESPPDCPVQWLGTTGGSMTMWRCGVGNYRQCNLSKVDVQAILEEREDDKVTNISIYDVFGVTEEECEALRMEIEQGRVDPHRPDRTLEILVQSGQLPRIETPRLRDIRVQKESPGERRTPVVILQMLDIHEVGGNIRRKGGNGNGHKEEEQLLEKMAA